MNQISTSFVSEIIKPRPLAMHKGNAGRALIIAGSKGMAGAAILAARGTLYSGAGLIKVSLPDELFTIMQISVPEVMCIGRENINWDEFDVVAVGPGLGSSRENYMLIKKMLGRFSGPVIIDADGINSLCEHGNMSAVGDVIRRRDGMTVFTPHPGEADRMLKASGLGGYKEMTREEVVSLLSDKLGAIVLLKGMDTLIKGQDSEIMVNPTGNPGMATGGSGDVLTGIITGITAQCIAGRVANEKLGTDEFMCADELDAVCTGAFIHGLAGDFAAENIGEMGMTAADIADAISMALKEFA